MKPLARLCAPAETLPWRARQRLEANHQIVHDSLYRREGWTRSFLLLEADVVAGFASIAVGGPWKDKPTVYEFYLLPEFRMRAFAHFEAALVASGARFLEVQTSDALLAVMLHTYGKNVVSEKIVFRDHTATAQALKGAVLRPLTPRDELLAAVEKRQGGGEWALEFEGVPVGKGGLLFHYNRPFGDVYMEIDAAQRRRGLGAFLVQELKRECYALGAVPAARCNPDNLASRATLQKAGFEPYAHILLADVVAA